MASKSSSQTRAPSLAGSERRLINPSHVRPLLYTYSMIKLVSFAKVFTFNVENYKCSLFDKVTLSVSRLIDMILKCKKKRIVEKRNMNIYNTQYTTSNEQ